MLFNLYFVSIHKKIKKNNLIIMLDVESITLKLNFQKFNNSEIVLNKLSKDVDR